MKSDTVPLLEYVKQRFDDAEKISTARFEAQQAAAEKAVELAKNALTKAEYTIQHDILVEKIEELSEARSYGRIAGIALAALGTGIISLLLYLTFLHVG